MSQDWMKEVPMNEVQEGNEALEGAEAEALEQEPIGAEAEAVQETAEEVPESIAEILQLDEGEKQAYQNIGTAVENMPVEGRIVGYKRGSCSERLIPIND